VKPFYAFSDNTLATALMDGFPTQAEPLNCICRKDVLIQCSILSLNGHTNEWNFSTSANLSHAFEENFQGFSSNRNVRKKN
jgi:hypothetical protein